MANARLNHAGSIESSELVQVEGYSGENHLDIYSCNCCYKHMSSLEDGLNYVSTTSKLSLTLVNDTEKGLSPGALILLICKFRILSQLHNGWPLVALYMVTELPLADAPK